MRKQLCFTAIELAFAIVGLFGLAIGGTVIYVALHFLAKFW